MIQQMTRLEQLFYDNQNKTPLSEVLSVRDKIRAVRSVGFAKVTEAAKVQYQGQNFIPIKILDEMIERIDPQPHHKIAAFDRYTKSILDLMGCKEVILFDRGDGFLATNMKFDIVIGNPPYQDSNKNPLYYKFHNRAVNLLNPDGKLAFITPDAMAIALETGYTKGRHSVELRKIEMINISTSIKKLHFKDVGINNFCWYVIENKPKTSDSYEIIHDDGISVGTMNPIKPLVNGSEVNSILAKCFEYALNPYDGGWYTAGKAARRDPDGTDYVALRIDEQGQFETYSVTHGKSHPLYGKPKVFITGFGNRAAVAYDHTLVCASEKLLWTVITNGDVESENLVHLVDCTLKKWLAIVIKARGPYIDFLKHFKGVPLDRKWTDAELYAHFGLTQDEIDHIERTVK